MGERREAHPAPLVGSEALNPSDKGAVVKLPRRRFLKARMCCCGRLGATAAGAGARLSDPAGALRGRLSAHCQFLHFLSANKNQEVLRSLSYFRANHTYDVIGHYT